MSISNSKLDSVIEEVFTKVEKDTGKKIFTYGTMDLKDIEKDPLEIMLVFTDKTIMHTFVDFEIVGGLLAVKIKGKYL